jgi:hypothetical protein
MRILKQIKNARRRVLPVLLTAVLVLSLLPMAASAAMPTPSEGEVYDGVDFTALLGSGNGIYYGKYDRATSLVDGKEEMNLKDIEQSLFSWLGHAEFGDTRGLRSQMLEKFILSKRVERDVD